MCVRKSAGLALLAFCLIAGQSEVSGVTTCAELRNAISGTTVTLENSFECTGEIAIGADNDITINGGGYNITFGAGFSSTNDALFDNLGTLTLKSLTITITPTEDEELVYVRGVYNKGELTVTGSSFESLNIGEDALDFGGAIYSDSSSSVTITESTFSSNVAGTKGGAIYATGGGTLTITNCEFNDNEAGISDDGTGSGGDIYADDGVTLDVSLSTFTYSATEIGGAAIEFCGGVIDDCDFIGSEADSDTDAHYGGALLVGRPDSGGCSSELFVSNSNFSSCSVNQVTGVGGSIAIFDTDASIKNCFFEKSQGTAVFFQSSSSHEIKVESSEFYENFEPSVAYVNGAVSQASAFVIQYTGDDEDIAPLASFDTIFCYANDPYECEFVYDGANVVNNGEFKCQICTLEGERLDVEEGELVDGDEDEDEDGGSSSKSSDNTGIVIGLSLALGVTLVVIGALAVWKVRVRNNARRLMEDMGDNDI